MMDLKLIECPRDAMQGIRDFIPTEKKIAYLNLLLKVGFDTLDFGSFVSPKAIPQLKDTKEVLAQLDLENSRSKLLAIVANERGAKEALEYSEIDCLGYPFSISETFQKRNTNAGISASVSRVEAIQNSVQQKNKKLVLYLSMGFGNPYGDYYHEDLVAEWVARLAKLEIEVFALSDTIGVAEPDLIHSLFSALISEFPKLEFGAHLHTRPDSWKAKVEAAHKAGCRRFDGAIAGYGGCPMAADDLTGNMPTESLIAYFMQEKLIKEDFDMALFQEAQKMADSIFPG